MIRHTAIRSEDIEAAHEQALSRAFYLINPASAPTIDNVRTEVLSVALESRGRDAQWNGGERIVDELHRRALELDPAEEIYTDAEHEKALEMNARFDALMELSEAGLTLTFNRSEQHLEEINSRDIDGVWVPAFERAQALTEAWLIAVVDDRRDKIAGVVEVVRARFEFDWLERLTALLGGDAEKAQHFATFTRR